MKPFHVESPTAIEAYTYGLKRRARDNHCIGNGLFPVEVTRLDEARRRYSRHVRPVTRTPMFIKAIALAVRGVPGANRIGFRRFPFGRRIVRFEDVDVSVAITRDMDGAPITFIATIRNADTLSIAQIQDQLVHFQRADPEQLEPLRKLKKLERAPRVLVRLYHWLMTVSPAFYRGNAGTCGMTTLDTMTGAHFFPIAPSSCVFAIGSAGERVVAREGKPVVRRMLDAALGIDNFVLSGPQGLAVGQRFQQLIESCSFVAAELAGTPSTPRPTGVPSERIAPLMAASR